MAPQLRAWPDVAEYVGMVALVAGVIIILLAAAPGIGGTIRSKIAAAVDSLLKPLSRASRGRWDTSNRSETESRRSDACCAPTRSSTYAPTRADCSGLWVRRPGTAGAHFGRFSKSMPVLGFRIGTAANLADGQSLFEAVTRSALTTGGSVEWPLRPPFVVPRRLPPPASEVWCAAGRCLASACSVVWRDFVGDVVFSDSAKEFYSDVGDFAGEAWDGATMSPATSETA